MEAGHSQMRSSLNEVASGAWTVSGSQEEKDDRGAGPSLAAGSSTLLLAIPLLVACAVAPVARAADPERLVVANARLVGRDAALQDAVVNVLVVDGKLLVITSDELIIEPDDIALDSSGGFLFGQLVLGARPSFLILDQDPRENVDVLLDTKTHARFAKGFRQTSSLQTVSTAI